MIMNYEHTYNVLYVVTVRVNFNLAYDYDYTTLWAHNNTS